MEVIILFSVFLVLLLVGMPIAFALGLASLSYLLRGHFVDDCAATHVRGNRYLCAALYSRLCIGR